MSEVEIKVGKWVLSLKYLENNLLYISITGTFHNTMFTSVFYKMLRLFHWVAARFHTKPYWVARNSSTKLFCASLPCDSVSPSTDPRIPFFDVQICCKHLTCHHSAMFDDTLWNFMTFSWMYVNYLRLFYWTFLNRFSQYIIERSYNAWCSHFTLIHFSIMKLDPLPFMEVLIPFFEAGSVNYFSFYRCSFDDRQYIFKSTVLKI